MAVLVALAEALTVLVPSLLHDFFVEVVSGGKPGVTIWAGERPLVS
jgi:hypothetical protein